MAVDKHVAMVLLRVANPHEGPITGIQTNLIRTCIFYPQILGSLREIIYLCIRVLKLKTISD